MKITPDTIEETGTVSSFMYEHTREYINEMLRDALENGDAIGTLKSIHADFRLAFLHGLEEHDQADLAISILNG